MIILGWYLLMVSIMPDGTVTGEVLDYYDDPQTCFSVALEYHMGKDPGLAFTCVEDFVDETEKMGV